LTAGGFTFAQIRACVHRCIAQHAGQPQRMPGCRPPSPACLSHITYMRPTYKNRGVRCTGAQVHRCTGAANRLIAPACGSSTAAEHTSHTRPRRLRWRPQPGNGYRVKSWVSGEDHHPHRRHSRHRRHRHHHHWAPARAVCLLSLELCTVLHPPPPLHLHHHAHVSFCPSQCTPHLPRRPRPRCGGPRRPEHLPLLLLKRSELQMGSAQLHPFAFCFCPYSRRPRHQPLPRSVCCCCCCCLAAAAWLGAQRLAGPDRRQQHHPDRGRQQIPAERLFARSLYRHDYYRGAWPSTATVGPLLLYLAS
jgi:hypothetical protein